ncbi:hypothetical protein [Bacillus atrophaeus]|uniref:hypothetical protein n=1 Tax=Bacillus atrophaeus TaxID=1452 RepID=UPI001CC257A8|nr:hypothetical protein [Bacillus atrophaeus]
MLIDQVKQLCDRLADHGLRDLLLEHGLDITADNIKEELLKPLTINRTIKGFEDFAVEGTRGIEPGHPARSLLYHALASPSVIIDGNGLELTSFPTLAEIETVENYVFGIEPPSLLEISSRGNGADLAIVVFTSEYRPAPETVHRKHADLCFSRTGVARVGTVEPLYHPKIRGFLPMIEKDEHAFRVLPARYSAYIAVKQRGNENEFGPMRFNKHHAPEQKDETKNFWVPLHKLFSGPECIRNHDLHVSLEAHHVNEKLKRIHLELGKEYKTGWKEPDINATPFCFTEGIAEWSDNPELGSNVLTPIPHPKFVEPAQYNGKPLTFNVPENGELFYSSLLIKDNNGFRKAPEYVHVRHILENGECVNLNNNPDMIDEIKTGGYKALHYIDYTGDGWVEAKCPELAVALPSQHAAYSLVTAPDFFINCDQRELLHWEQQSVPDFIKKYLWETDPFTLSDNRVAANIELKKAGFDENDDTMTAIVSLPYKQPPKNTSLNVPETTRHSYLPDAASGVFAPGWDVSVDRTPEGVEFLAAYGLGSPFPEDAKLCAALSTFWPAVAPDAARTFDKSYPTVSPLTDEEIGQVGELPWDGVPGPQIIKDGSEEFIDYPALEYVDYVDNALKNKYSMALTGKVDVREYAARVLNMSYVYKALGVNLEDLERENSEQRREITRRKAKWTVLSFKKVSSSDEELQEAQLISGVVLSGSVYRFVVYRKGEKSIPSDFRKVRFKIKDKVILFTNGVNILLKRGEKKWECKDVNKL